VDIQREVRFKCLALPFGQRMRTLRRVLGMTQKQFADTLGVSVRTVIRHERDQYRDTAPNVTRMFWALVHIAHRLEARRNLGTCNFEDRPPFRGSGSVGHYHRRELQSKTLFTSFRRCSHSCLPSRPRLLRGFSRSRPIFSIRPETVITHSRLIDGAIALLMTYPARYCSEGLSIPSLWQTK
jgi:DNA-binding XRE family transcriptional regulator